MIASMMIGRKLIVSAGVMPKMCSPQPHWNIATCAPSAAAIESRKPRIDLIGTRIVRNANVSRMNARPTTTIRKIGRALDSLAETSMLDAVVPPTRMCAPVWPSIAARSSRSVCTRLAVAESFGPDFGISRISEMPFCAASGVTCATSGILLSAPAICWVSEALWTPWATISSAPLKPAPKPSVVRSYALRWVLPVDCEAPERGDPADEHGHPVAHDEPGPAGAGGAVRVGGGPAGDPLGASTEQRQLGELGDLGAREAQHRR